jgi:hypothetical protein
MRLPDFIIIGAMKSGTSSLHGWLADQPECWLPALKEPNFFSDQPEWNKGLDWYAGLFAKAPADRLTGEASVRYTSPSWAPVAARRMAAVVPAVRLLYIVRHPVERIRSHYRHWLAHKWGDRSLARMMREQPAEFLGRSLYHKCLLPYIERFPREQICVVRFEDLIQEPYPAWARVLEHLGLTDRPAPGRAYNVSQEIPHFPDWIIRLRRKGLLRPVKRWPAPVRRTGRKFLARFLGGRRGSYEEIRARSMDPIPDEILEELWEDIGRLEVWLGVEHPLWPR